jgi:hypothetical protein
MKIIYLGQELDSNKEHEIFSDNEFGFKVDIKHTEESWYRVKEDTAYNCTEFHWRYNEKDDWVENKSVAFESDIHRTGFTREINTIESVIIEIADKLYDEY